MKLLWLSGARAIGGAEQATLQLAALLRTRGHLISLLCPTATPLAGAALAAGIPVHPGAVGRHDLRTLGALTAVLRSERPDVVLVASSGEWAWACLAPRERGRTRLVLVRHMVLPLSPPLRWLVNRRADAVVAVSAAVRDGLRGIDSGLTHVIPVGPRFSPRPAVPADEERVVARAELGIPLQGRWIGFFGGLAPNKGVADALIVRERAERVLGETRLLAGGPAGAGGPGQFPAALVADGRVHHLGYITRMDTALTAADVVVLATRRSLGEAMPLTVLEAMACGTPVAAYAVGGVPEALGPDEIAGRLARPDDAEDLARVVVELLADAGQRRQLAAAALARVRERFDPDRLADRWDDLIRRWA